MKVGLAVAMQESASSEEADFTSAAELEDMLAFFRGMGHQPVTIDFSAPFEKVIEEISRNDPHLIFNTIEQVRGELHPSGFVPSMSRALGRPCTGPGPRAITLGSDKWLTKRTVGSGEVRFARDVRVTSRNPFDGRELESVYPVIVKPNFGGSSQGIGIGSVAHSPAEVASALEELTGFLEAGVLIEEFIPGRDITVGLVESNGDWRVLAPIEYETPPTAGEHLLTEELKTWAGWGQVKPRRAEILVPEQTAELRDYAVAMARGVGAATAARVDFRLSEKDHRLYALEINVIAAIEAEAGLALSAQHAGLDHSDLISHILSNAH